MPRIVGNEDAGMSELVIMPREASAGQALLRRLLEEPVVSASLNPLTQSSQICRSRAVSGRTTRTRHSVSAPIHDAHIGTILAKQAF